MPQVSIADFDFEGRVLAEERRKELEQRNRDYVTAHPELQQILHDIMEAVLFHKPDDALGFLQDHVRQHREKHENVSAQ